MNLPRVTDHWYSRASAVSPFSRLAALILSCLFFPQAVLGECLDLAEIYPDVVDSVVRIESAQEGEALGSGFIVQAGSDGETTWVVTNAHVLGSHEQLTVSGNGKGPWEASLLGRDQALDLAILELTEPPELEGLVLRRSPLNVGEAVWAMGSPFGLEASLSSGYLGAMGRYFTAKPSVPFLQLDMALNPGGSGGPVLDRDGRVIGVNTQVLGRQDNQAGLAFAIPAWVLERYLARLTRHGDEGGYLGLYLEDPPESLVVSAVVNDSPADQAGVRAGDRLYSAESGPEAKGEFRHRLLMPLPGETMQLVRENSAGDRESLSMQSQHYSDGNRRVDWLGIEGRRHRDGGVKVVSVDQSQTILEVGDRLLYQGRSSLEHPFDLDRPGTGTAPLLIIREGQRFFVAAPTAD